VADTSDRSSTPLRAAAVTWVYAAGFGGSTVPVSIWSRRFDDSTFVKLLISYLPVTGVTALAWRLWRGSRRGTVMSVALLPVEAVYWLGFALPIPWVLGASGVALVAASWKRLR
jgi:hypothetical protein